MTGRSEDIPTPPGRASGREQSRKLDSKIQALLAQQDSTQPGAWRLESRSDTRAVLIRERKVNHRLHLLLTILTLGFWVFVWMVVAAHSTEPQRKVLKA